MIKVSNTKKKRKKKTNNKGFTLVELLATISILSLVAVIVIYVAIDVIGKAKNNSYQVTINNIEDVTNGYVLENNNSISWIDYSMTDYEYQCVTVQSLMDMGYFKSDVLDSYVDEDVKVDANNYVYLERNKINKAITKNVLLVGDRLNTYSSLCNNISTEGNISFSVSPSGWSKQKNIVINYHIYNNVDDESNYKYNYVYGDTSLNNNFNRKTMVENLTVDENGTLHAKIEDENDDLITNNSLVITKIDNEVPVASITSTNNVADKQTATLNMRDNAGVVAYYFGKENPKNEDVDWIEIAEVTSKTVTAQVDAGGTWYLGVKDVVGLVTVVNKVFYKTTLFVENATVTPTEVITMKGNSFTLPNVRANAYYTFNGWYTSSNYSGSAITTYKPENNKMIYGKTIENKLTGGVVQINGSAIYGNTLTAEITEDTVPKADSYSYQWYTNTVKSTTGGTKINGATGKTLALNAASFNKYVYVEITAKKNNYRSTTFSNITSTVVGKRQITVTAGSKSKVYDGTPLKDSSCTAENLAFSHTVSCEMTSASSITNVGKVNNVINTVSIYNNEKTGTVNQYYNITKKVGTLTVTKASAVIPVASAYCQTGLTYTGSQQTLTKTTGTGYSFSNNKQTDAGTYTVTATLDNNHKWKDGTTGNKTLSCSIGKATPTMSVNPGSLSLLIPTSGSSTYAYNGDGKVSCSSSNVNIATCSVDTTKKQVTVAPLKNGSVTITLSAAAGTNYNAISKTISVSVTSQYTISYNANGGIGAPASQTKIHNEDLTLSSTKPTKDGYNFLGWSTSSSATSATYDPGDTYTDNASVTLYAIWKKKTYTVSYKANGGNGTIDSQTKTHGVSLTLSDGSKLTRANYTFLGWSTSSSATSATYNAGGTYTNNASVTLYAVWKQKNKVYIRFKTNGGSVKTPTTSDEGTEYNWDTNSSGVITRDGTVLQTSMNYDGQLGTDGLPNYNNSKYLKITKTGYSAVSQQEWKCLSGCSQANRTFDQATQYNANDFCNASTADCTVVLGVNWTPNTYTISYNLNNGTKGTNAPTSTTYDTVVKVNNPTKTVTVSGNANGTGATVGTSVSKTQTFTGWTFNGNTSTAKYGTSSTSVTTSWSENDNKVTATFFKNLKTSGSVTLTANWSSETVNLPTVTKAGYTCNWNTKPDGSGTSYDSGVSYLISANGPTSITMYAQCTASSYTISYNANGGSGAPTSQPKTHGVALTLSSTRPTRANHTFLGWSTSSSATSVNYDPGDTYTANASVTLYAVWKKNKVYIRFKTNGGSVKTPTTSDGGTNYNWATKTYNGESNVIFKDGSVLQSSMDYDGQLGTDGLPNYNNSKYLKITKTGYSAVSQQEWKCLSGCSQANSTFNQATQYNANNFCNTSNGDCTVYLGVNWTSNTYTISYDANGGSGAPGSQIKTYGVSLTLSSTKPTRDGYTFKGWSASSSATSATYAAGGTYTANESRTLYAVWQPNTYTISYNANSGKGAPGIQTKKHNENLTLSSIKPTKQYYVFAGWNTEANGTGTPYAAGGTYTANASVTLYAVWKMHTHDWTAIGTNLYTFGESLFTCGEMHTQGYAIYCSICGMSANYFEHVLGFGETSGYVCHCGWASKFNKYFDDSSLNKNTNALKNYGGVLYGKELFGTTSKPPIMCDSNHNPISSSTASGGNSSSSSSGGSSTSSGGNSSSGSSGGSSSGSGGNSSTSSGR